MCVSAREAVAIRRTDGRRWSLEYAWAWRLGGRRPAAAASRHIALRHEAFRGYADHMETAEPATETVAGSPTAPAPGRVGPVALGAFEDRAQ